MMLVAYLLCVVAAISERFAIGTHCTVLHTLLLQSFPEFLLKLDVCWSSRLRPKTFSSAFVLSH